MKFIIPMAGAGKRLRPHTFSIPKPFMPVAGKAIVEWLIEELIRLTNKTVEEIVFIISDFNDSIKSELKVLSKKYNTECKIYYQNEPLGTAHAVYCAETSLYGEIIIAFADTIFFGDLNLNQFADSLIWVKQVENPSQFGVVKTNKQNIITNFIEKPKDKVSDLAIIGIYYFKDGITLKDNISYLLNNNIKGNNEFQLTDVLKIMNNKGLVFAPSVVEEWLDCGNKNALIYANKKLLQRYNFFNNIKFDNSVIINPCFIADNVILKNSVIGPDVSIYQNANIENCIINNSIIYANSTLLNAIISDSIIGSHVSIIKKLEILDIGDYCQVSDC